jgi:hypothetical protein
MYRAASVDFAWKALSPLEFSSIGPPPHLGALLAGSLLRHAEVSLQWTPSDAALATGAVTMLGGFPSLPVEPRFAPPSAAELGPIFAVRRLVRFDARGRMGILPDIWTRLLSNPSLQGLRSLLVGRAAEYVPLALLGVRQVQEQEQELMQEQDEQQQQLPQESFLPALTHLHVSTRHVLFLPLVRAALAGVDSMVRLRHLSLFESSWSPVGAPDQGPRLALRQAAVAASNGHVTRLALGHIRLPLVADLLLDTPLAHALRVLTLCLDVVEGLSGEHDALSAVSADKAASALPPFDWAGIWASMPLLEQLSLHIFHGADTLLLGLAEEVAARAPSLRRLRVRPLHLARPDIDAATAAGSDENALPPSLVSPLPSLSIVRRLLSARPHLRYTLQLLPRADYLQSHAAHEPHAAEDWDRVHTQWHGALVRQFGEHRVYLQFRPHGAPPEEKEN